MYDNDYAFLRLCAASTLFCESLKCVTGHAEASISFRGKRGLATEASKAVRN